jgi:glycosyltransferase involved in cell wall biosynthesis
MDTRGGWGRLSHEVITRLMDRGYDIDVLTEHASEFPNEKPILGRSFGAFKNLPEIRQHIKKADLIHSWEANPYAISAYCAAVGLGKKKIITATGAYSIKPFYNPKTKALIKHVYKTADRTLCISQYIKDEIDKIVPVARTEVVTLGVDFEKFTGERKLAQEPFVLSVGNVGYRKGYHVSIPAFAEVAKIIPNIKYYIAGATDNIPSYYNECKELIKKYQLEDRVVFLGSLNDEQLKRLYLSAELFLLPSVNFDHHFEGFGLVFLEAASAGLPVIGTTGNGIADAVNADVNGLLVPQNDVSATAKAMLKILNDSDCKQRYSAESFEWAKLNSWKRMVDRYEHVYKRVLGVA